MYLLDTNAISELRKGPRAHPNFQHWALRNDTTNFFLSVITILEIERGIKQVQSRDPHQYVVLRRWMEKYVLGNYADRILDVTVPVAMGAAQLHLPQTRPESDALIAATALVHDMAIVSRNVRDFEGTGVRIVNPWESSSSIYQANKNLDFLDSLHFAHAGDATNGEDHAVEMMNVAGFNDELHNRFSVLVAARINTAYVGVVIGDDGGHLF